MARLWEAPPARAGLGLLHADGLLLVLDKPAGLLAVPGRGADKQDCLAARVQRLYPEARIVHRLDMATSGLLLMARGLMAQRQLSAAFEQREVAKRYQAVVAGRLATPADADDEGWSCIALPLAADWPRRPMQKVDTTHGRPSLTRWRVLGHGDGTTRLELEPLTGRTHQLRVHLQAIGHPILGDALYAPPQVQAAAPRLLLHASELGVAHPGSGEALRWRSPPPF
ncbi:MULTISPECIES: RluA family pseudouridine synthase [Ramlibacter]|uniref:Dual-specificity RNA pseudouridine synthase RluA n=1 Tax=Ramlibacter aquaticus TaxID=2780094 RepID=A0ABR9SBJ5_9BURK|nr:MULTISPECIES: RluA family pseudouridine synthase [Ramlibacter]MBE7939229.1 RluA family pseudouridine synthase [Ramlibacter aquaticus]